MVADTLPRRLAAILYLDVVEFSRLTHDNEDATYRTLQNYLRDIDDVIENRGGRTVDRSGDNLLAVFPVAADSVMAAVNIQERLTTRNALCRLTARFTLVSALTWATSLMMARESLAMESTLRPACRKSHRLVASVFPTLLAL